MREGELRLRIVGSSSAVPRPGCACSSYLVQSANTNILLDCGTGALANLQRIVDPSALNAVLISHMHADHMFDLVPLRYYFAFAQAGKKALPVFVHPGGIEHLRRLAQTLPSESGERFFEKGVRLAEYDPAQPLVVGDVCVEFTKTVHYIDAYAMRVTHAGKSIVYSTDTAPCQQVVDLAHGANVYLSECALGADGTEGSFRGHSNAFEAGATARAAKVEHLVLTHYGAQSEPPKLRAAAARGFGGKITVAEDGMIIEV